ncbi:MAG: DUF1559 domain-containing protein [Planctomycetaceae bacterium]
MLLRAAAPQRRGLSLVEVLAVVAIVGTLVGMMLPALGGSRESARQIQCRSHQRQMGLAILGFEAVHRVFPASGWTRAGPGNPHGTAMAWRTVILPYLEEDDVRTLYDPRRHWWEGTNLAVASIPIPTYVCPSTPPQDAVTIAIAKPPRPMLALTRPLARADHEAILGVQPASVDPTRYGPGNRHAVIHRNSTTRHAAITDGTSRTVMVVEAAGRPRVWRRGGARPDLTNDQGIGWIDGEGAFSLDGAAADGSLEGCGAAHGCPAALNARNDNEPWSFHPGGLHALFADGHATFIHESVALGVMAAWCTRAAGDDPLTGPAE